jgi:hypothetical protein
MEILKNASVGCMENSKKSFILFKEGKFYIYLKKLKSTNIVEYD